MSPSSNVMRLVENSRREGRLAGVKKVALMGVLM